MIKHPATAIAAGIAIFLALCVVGSYLGTLEGKRWRKTLDDDHRRLIEWRLNDPDAKACRARGGGAVVIWDGYRMVDCK